MVGVYRDSEVVNRVFPYTEWVANKWYANNGLLVKKNTKGYIHALKCEVVNVFNGTWTYGINEYLLTKEEMFKFIDTVFQTESKEVLTEHFAKYLEE